MTSAPVGRTAVWDALVRWIPPDRPALVLISGAPGSGRSYLLSRFGEAAAEMGMRVAGWRSPLSVDRTVQLGDIGRALAAELGTPLPAPEQAAGERNELWARAVKHVRALTGNDRMIFAALEDAAPVWIGIDGYSPHRTLAVWMTAWLLPRLRSRRTRVVLAIAGTPQQLADLVDSADEHHELAALDVQEIADHLVALGRATRPPFGVQEAHAYAEIVSRNPALLSALDAILPVVSEVQR